MFDILYIIMPVFLIMAVGYIANWRGAITNDQVDTLTYFAQTFAIPCLLFTAVANLNLAQVFNAPLFASYYISAFMAFVLGGVIAFWFFKRTPAQSVSIGFTAMFSNTVLIGLPIMELAFGKQALQSNYAIISVHVPFCYIIGITLMETLRADGAGYTTVLKNIVRTIFKSPLAVALMLGFMFNFSGLSMPAVVSSALDMMVRSALPVALFALGAILPRYKITNNLPEVAAVALIKLILFPAIAYFLSTQVFDLPEMARNSVVITAAMAPGINTYIFASIYNRGKATAATSVVICTLLSVFSISVWLLILT